MLMNSQQVRCRSFHFGLPGLYNVVEKPLNTSGMFFAQPERRSGSLNSDSWKFR